jgi:hypothetical protein
MAESFGSDSGEVLVDAGIINHQSDLDNSLPDHLG